MDVLGQCMKEFLVGANQPSYFYPHQKLPQCPSSIQLPPNSDYFPSNSVYMQPQPNYYIPQAFHCLPPPPSDLATLLPPQQQQLPSAGSFMLGTDGTMVQQQQFPIQPMLCQVSEAGKYFNQLEVSTSNTTIIEPSAVNKLWNTSNNGIPRSNSSGILHSTSNSQTSSSNLPPISSGLPSTASIASSLNTLAASLGLCDRFSPSSSSSASVDSGFADITSFSPSPDSVCSNQSKSSAFSLPQSNSSHSLLMLSNNNNSSAPLNFSHLHAQKSGAETFAIAKNLPLQLPILQNPLTIYGSVGDGTCVPPPNKLRRVDSQAEEPKDVSEASEAANKMESIECKASPPTKLSTQNGLMLDIKMEEGAELNDTMHLEVAEKEISVPLPEPEPSIEESCDPSTSNVTSGSDHYEDHFACGWASCQERLDTENELYDHVVKEHLEKLRPVASIIDESKSQQNSTRLSRRRRSSNGNSASSSQKSKNSKEKEEEDKFCCRWKDCEMFTQRGDSQKQFDWLLDHYTTRHAPRAQPFVCLFAQCTLRFRMRRSLNDHIRRCCAQDNMRITGKKNGSLEENKAASSCFGFKPRVQIPPRIDCMDTRTMQWVRDQLKQFNQMQKPCLINEQQPAVFNQKQHLLNSRAQFRKMRRHSTQFLMEFDKILSFNRSISSIDALTRLPEVVALDTIPKRMAVHETQDVLSGIFKQPKSEKGQSNSF